jgi:hypothetical protein
VPSLEILKTCGSQISPAGTRELSSKTIVQATYEGMKGTHLIGAFSGSAIQTRFACRAEYSIATRIRVQFQLNTESAHGSHLER